MEVEKLTAALRHFIQPSWKSNLIKGAS